MGLCYPGIFPVKNQKSHPKKGRKHTTCRTSGKLGTVWEKLLICMVILQDFSGILHLIRMCLKVVPALQRSRIKRSRILDVNVKGP